MKIPITSELCPIAQKVGCFIFSILKIKTMISRAQKEMIVTSVIIKYNNCTVYKNTKPSFVLIIQTIV
jgi:hypothetical protein